MKKLASSLIVAAALGMASLSASAVEVAGIKIEDTAKVAGKDLVLNGAGVRVKVVFKVYALGLYLTEKKTKAADVLNAAGPKRFKIVMMRDLTGEEVGSSFLGALDKNLDASEKTKLSAELRKFSDTFKTISGMKPGDVIVGDWIPGTGSVLTLNGKPLAEPMPEPLFYNAMLRIWVGTKPADDDLKEALLGG
jgi:chalcone isomerase-like protein